MFGDALLATLVCGAAIWAVRLLELARRPLAQTLSVAQAKMVMASMVLLVVGLVAQFAKGASFSCLVSQSTHVMQGFLSLSALVGATALLLARSHVSGSVGRGFTMIRVPIADWDALPEALKALLVQEGGGEDLGKKDVVLLCWRGTGGDEGPIRRFNDTAPDPSLEFAIDISVGDAGPSEDRKRFNAEVRTLLAGSASFSSSVHAAWKKDTLIALVSVFVEKYGALSLPGTGDSYVMGCMDLTLESIPGRLLEVAQDAELATAAVSALRKATKEGEVINIFEVENGSDRFVDVAVVIRQSVEVLQDQLQVEGVRVIGSAKGHLRLAVDQLQPHGAKYIMTLGRRGRELRSENISVFANPTGRLSMDTLRTIAVSSLLFVSILSAVVSLITPTLHLCAASV